jgi:hypothetical protein
MASLPLGWGKRGIDKNATLRPTALDSGNLAQI